MNQLLDLVPAWTLLLGIGVFFYVLLDGFDLGVGMLYGFAPDAIPQTGHNTMRRSGTATRPGWFLAASGSSLLSARFRDHHTGGLFPHPHYAASAHLPRRRI